MTNPTSNQVGMIIDTEGIRLCQTMRSFRYSSIPSLDVPPKYPHRSSGNDFINAGESSMNYFYYYRNSMEYNSYENNPYFAEPIVQKSSRQVTKYVSLIGLEIIIPVSNQIMRPKMKSVKTNGII
jgi:hypothetical protein